MKKSTTGAIIFVLIFAIAIMAYIFITNPFVEVRTEDTTSAVEITEDPVDTSLNDEEEGPETTGVLVEVEFRVDDQAYPISVPDYISGYELMEVIAVGNEDFTFSGSDSEYGFFVEEINGVANDTANSDYWSLYVNDELSQVGISDYIVQDGDIVEWRYEHVEF